MKEIRINSNDAHQRLDKFLMKTFPKLSNSMMYKAIRNKKIKVNRKLCTFDQKIQENDSILLFLPPDVLEEKQVDTQYISSQLDVIYEDENILIANNSQRTLEGIDGNRYITYINNSVIHYLSPSLGSNTLRKPSPKNAKPSIVILIATAGKINWNG